jgi:hypothetical protein
VHDAEFGCLFAGSLATEKSSRRFGEAGILCTSSTLAAAEATSNLRIARHLPSYFASMQPPVNALGNQAITTAFLPAKSES